MDSRAAVEFVFQTIADGDDSELGQCLSSVHYGSVGSAPQHSKLIILPSVFFDSNDYGTTGSMPDSISVLETTSVKVPILFGQPKITRDEKGRLVLHADVIASAFFLLTRYEETIRQDIRDQYGRFPGKESLAFREGFLNQPVVDQYGQLILDLLKQEGVDLKKEVNQPKFSLVLTHDIDDPFRFLYLHRTLGLSLLQTFGKRTGKPLDSLRSWIGTKKDPFDTFDWMNERFQDARQHLGDRVTQVYFVMACDNGPRDKGFTVENKRVRELLKRLKKSGAEFGLHPSYKAGTHPEEIVKEKERLESVLEMPVTKTRHHYLRLREPSHTNWLIEAGFTDDYSAGYADVAGFRNGTARPFHYFDLDKQVQTDLRIHPLPIMECTFEGKNYMNLNLEEATEQAQFIAQQSMDQKGELVLLWHNSVFAAPQSAYFTPFYEKILKYIYQQQCP